MNAAWKARGRGLSYQSEWKLGHSSYSMQLFVSPNLIKTSPFSFDLFPINPGDSSSPCCCELDGKRLMGHFKATLSPEKCQAKQLLTICWALLLFVHVSTPVKLSIITYNRGKDVRFTTSKLRYGSLIFRLMCTKTDVSFLAGKPMILSADMLLVDFIRSC